MYYKLKTSANVLVRTSIGYYLELKNSTAETDSLPQIFTEVIRGELFSSCKVVAPLLFFF